MPDLLCSTRDDIDIITVGADLDIYTSPSLREATLSPVLRARGRLVIDLSATTFIDHLGLGVIIGVLKRIRKVDGSLAIACSHEGVLRMFRITGLERVLDIHETVDEAVAAVKEASDA